MRNTKSQIKYEGQKLFYDENGEIITMNVTVSEQKDFNFHKIWMTEALQKLGLIGNRKTKVAYRLLDLMKNDNTITYTYTEIAELVGVSIQTVVRTMQALIDADFMKRKRPGYYVLNPGLIFKGKSQNRAYYLTEYRAIESANETEEYRAIETQKTTNDKSQERVEALIKSKEALMKQIKETEKALELELINQKTEFQKLEKQIADITQENQVVNK